MSPKQTSRTGAFSSRRPAVLQRDAGGCQPDRGYATIPPATRNGAKAAFWLFTRPR